MELLAQPDGMDVWNNMKCWGHSHVNMGVFASGQDDTQMNVFKDAGHDFFIRVIANKKGEMEFTFYNYATGIIYKDTPWAILRSQQNADQIRMINEAIASLKKQLEDLEGISYPELSASIKTEIASKVKKKVYTWGYQNNKGLNTPYLGAKDIITDYEDDIYNYMYEGENYTGSGNVKKKQNEKSEVIKEEKGGNPQNYLMAECVHHEDLLDWFVEDDIKIYGEYIVNEFDDIVEVALDEATYEVLTDSDKNYLMRLILSYNSVYGFIDKAIAKKHKDRLLGLKPLTVVK